LHSYSVSVLLDHIALQHIAGLNIVPALQADAALIAGRYILYIVLKPL